MFVTRLQGLAFAPVLAPFHLFFLFSLTYDHTYFCALFTEDCRVWVFWPTLMSRGGMCGHQVSSSPALEVLFSEESSTQDLLISFGLSWGWGSTGLLGWVSLSVPYCHQESGKGPSLFHCTFLCVCSHALFLFWFCFCAPHQGLVKKQWKKQDSAKGIQYIANVMVRMTKYTSWGNFIQSNLSYLLSG